MKVLLLPVLTSGFFKQLLMNFDPISKPIFVRQAGQGILPGSGMETQTGISSLGKEPEFLIKK